MSERPAVAIYAALSRKRTKRDDDDRADEESIESQIAKVTARLDVVYRDTGFDLLGVYDEIGHSGSTRNRGPKLEAAISATSAVADEDARTRKRGTDPRTVELWGNTSARFARGSGKREEARSILELFTDLRRRGVDLRTVEDDEFVTNEMLVGFASAQASKYAKDLSESVTRAKRRQAERGKHLGGPLPLGYVNGSNPPTFDPNAKPTVTRIFDLALKGVSDAQVARIVNQEGHRTRAGRPLNRRSIQAIVLNPFYAGLIVYEGSEYEAAHDQLVDRDAWRHMVTARLVRDNATPDQKVRGRPAQNHALARLAICGRCGERLLAVTSTYRRKDGTRARQYMCQSYKLSTATCDAKPISAELVDAAVIAGLDTLLVDFDAWRERIQDGHTTERDRLAGEVKRARRDHDAQANKVAKMETKWSEYIADDDDRNANLVLSIVERERQAGLGAQRRLRAAQDALESVPTDTPTDAMLDFANALRQAVKGRMDATNTMAEVNQALREMFVCFQVKESEGDGLFDGIMIEPWLRPGVVLPSDPELGWALWPKLVKATDDPPPLAWLEQTNLPHTAPDGNEQNSQA